MCTTTIEADTGTVTSHVNWSSPIISWWIVCGNQMLYVCVYGNPFLVFVYLVKHFEMYVVQKQNKVCE